MPLQPGLPSTTPAVSFRRDRPGFTLVEMLVVIAVIGILLGIIMPATQSAREAARRTQCLNNQRQMALAAISHGHRKTFLPGWRNALALTASGSANPSWPVMILPYMDRSDIYNLWVSGSAASTTPYLDIFVCPSQPQSIMSSPWLAYAGNAGSGTAGTRWDGVMTDIATSSTNRMSLEDISDGIAYTLLLSEKAGAFTNTGTGNATLALWSGTFSNSFSWLTGTTSIPVFGLAPTVVGSGTRVINTGTALASPGTYSQPSSAHTGGAVAAFCDGHTIFLRDTLRTDTYAELCTSRDSGASTIATGTWGTASYTLSDGDYNQ